MNQLGLQSLRRSLPSWHKNNDSRISLTSSHRPGWGRLSLEPGGHRLEIQACDIYLWCCHARQQEQCFRKQVEYIKCSHSWHSQTVISGNTDSHFIRDKYFHCTLSVMHRYEMDESTWKKVGALFVHQPCGESAKDIFGMMRHRCEQVWEDMA